MSCRRRASWATMTPPISSFPVCNTGDCDGPPRRSGGLSPAGAKIDNRGMDTEGAEIHFRRLAERALREVAAEPDVLARVASVERALTVTGAIDAHRAEAIKADLRIAVKAREPRRPSAPPGLGAVLRFPSRRQQFTATSSGVALPGSAELRRASPAASSP